MGSCTPRLRVEVLWNYLLGGAAFLYIISLWASLCYAAKWANDNTWQRKQYGRFQTVNSIAVAIAIFAIFAALVVMGALALNIFLPKMAKIELILWGVGMLLSFIVIALESAGVDYNTYGDAYQLGSSNEVNPVCDDWAYNSNDDFKEYVDKHTTNEWQQAGGFSRFAQWNFEVAQTAIQAANPNLKVPGLPVQVNELFGDAGADAEASGLFSSWGLGYENPFLVPYRTCSPSPLPHGLTPTPPPDGSWYSPEDAAFVDPGKHTSFSVPSCVFNWTALAISGKLNGEDPCEYDLGGDAECIGGWDPESVRDFWCESYEFAKEVAEKFDESPSEAAKLYGGYDRARWSIRSLSAFYRHCTYLLYMQVCALIVTAIVLYFLHFHKGGSAPAPAAKSEEV